ncbi:DNA mismatch repair protein Msh6 [Backusella circina FSU 941]|nr:DNA mismatch repair protein Msh6 [Backusella circina FSU 941]
MKKTQNKGQTSLLSFFGAAKPKNTVTPTPPPPPPPQKTPKKTVRFALDLEEEEVEKKVKENVEPGASDMDVDEAQPSKKGRLVKRVSYLEGSSDEEETPIKAQPGKRRRLIQHVSEESEDEFVPGDDKDEDMKEEEFIPEMEEPEEPEEPEEKTSSSSAISPVVNRFRNISVSKPPKNAFSQLTSKQEQRKEKAEKFQKDNEDRYKWLQDIKDADKNPVGSENYDPRTLYIPDSAWRAFKPFEKQYWEIKAKHWDSVVFFKKGKFYELYEKDAFIGHQDFDLKLTARVNMSMVGVPESSFDFWAAQFIAKGYRVAKVDQMETAIGKSIREKDAQQSKADKLVRRELTSVLTQGTLVDAGLLTNDLGTYCMSIKEVYHQKTPTYGVCFVDTATAEFNLAVFEDDVNRTKLETLLMQIKPREIITEKGRLDINTTRLLKNSLSEPLWNMLIPEREFWSSMTTQDELRIRGYFGEEESNFPEALKKVKDNDVVMSAFGGMIWYLRSLKLDTELLSAKNIAIYDPVRNSNSLVLDGQTLANLEIFENTLDGGSDGTVLKLLANTITPFGKRLFRKWLCHPLYKIQEIEARLDAVEDFMRLMDLTQNISNKLAKIPDLERLISRIHSGRCKVSEFLTALDGFKDTVGVMDALKKDAGQFKSKLLNSLVEKYPNLDDKLDYFSNGFTIATVDVDYQKMKTIIPNPGVNAKWDDINDQIKDIQREFDQHLKEVRSKLGANKIEYKNIGKEINQLEVPKGTKVPADWIQLSSTAKVTRYWNPTVKALVTQYKELIEHKNECVKEFTKGVYQEFDQHYTLWMSAVQNIATLDVLMSLAKGSSNMGEPACRPQFVNSEKGVIEFKDLRHPCVATGINADFIPNDVNLGGEDPSLIVLTGPNMGGKSTLLRQTCVAVIMAQLGCYVPASSCVLTPCDRIFTRIGANDNIMGGESTFMVELSETSKILREASSRSMVILDELGRGTSTFDGYAIAYAVLHYLSTHIGCLGMFSTHYQTLCKEFERNPEINNMHMDYLLENDQVIFLYKLVKGICEKSFGMNVAMMAGVPKSIVDEARRAADDFEKQHKLKDSTWTEETVKSSPSVLADLRYLMSNNTKANVVDRIIKSFKQL